MVLVIAAVGLVTGLIALALIPRLGVVSAFSLTGFFWWLVVIAVVTLVPANGPTGYRSPDSVQTSCSWDIGGPAPEGFWIFDGGQRTLNTALFVPAGALLVLAFGRWRSGWLLVPLGLAGLLAYSAAIEKSQLELARIDRACDITDIIDNGTGAVFGFGIGLVLLLILRPWRHRHRRLAARGR